MGKQRKFPKFTEEEKRKFYEQVAHSSKISRNKKKYLRAEKRRTEYDGETENIPQKQ